MIHNPYAAVPYKEAAWSEGFCKGLAAMVSPAPGDSIAEADVDAFNEGVAAGSDAAANGIALDSPCVAALEGDPGRDVAFAVDAAHLLHAGWEARHLATLAGALTSLLIVVIELGTAGAH